MLVSLKMLFFDKPAQKTVIPDLNTPTQNVENKPG
jgi:hypothetical protein